MAFMEDRRIYYSGRIKDMIIVRGQNFYAQVIWELGIWGGMEGFVDFFYIG